MKVPSIVLHPSAAETGRQGAARPLPPLAVGRVVSARVAAGGDGVFILELEGGRVTARTSIGLVPGEELMLVVRDAGPPPVLSLLPSQQENSAAALFSRLLSVFEANPVEVDAFSVEILSMLAAVGGAPAGQRADPLSLLRLVSFMLSRRDGDAGVMRHGTEDDSSDRAERKDRLSGLVRSFNQSAGAGRALFVFPVILARDQGSGAWFLSRDREGNGSLSVDLFLALSALGEVRVRLSGLGDAVRVELWLAEPDARAHVDGMLPELVHSLERAAGLRISASVHAAQPACGAEMARLLRERGGALLDARA